MTTGPASRCIRIVAFAIIAIASATAVAEPLATPPKPDESLDAGTLRVDKFGTGKQALVLIPGLGSGPWVWNGTIAKFSPTHTIYVLTLPGFDGRAATEEKDLFAVFSRDLWAMLEARKIEKPVVIGHNLGGALAIMAATEHPERLAGIIAADGLPVFPMLAHSTPAQRETMATQMAGMFSSMSADAAFAAQKGYIKTVGTNKPELIDPIARL